MRRLPHILALAGALLGTVLAALSSYDFAKHLDRQVHALHCGFGASGPNVASGCKVAMMSSYSSLFRGAVWRDMFHYGDRLAPKMASPHRINFNRRDAPTYCTHCAASNRAQLESASSPATPLFFVIDGHAQTAPGAPCRCYVYKKDARREDIDPALFEQIGLVPPKETRA